MSTVVVRRRDGVTDALRLGDVTRDADRPPRGSRSVLPPAERGHEATTSTLGAGCGESRLSVLDGGLLGDKSLMQAKTQHFYPMRWDDVHPQAPDTLHDGLTGLLAGRPRLADGARDTSSGGSSREVGRQGNALDACRPRS